MQQYPSLGTMPSSPKQQGIKKKVPWEIGVGLLILLLIIVVIIAIPPANMTQTELGLESDITVSTVLCESFTETRECIPLTDNAIEAGDTLYMLVVANGLATVKEEGEYYISYTETIRVGDSQEELVTNKVQLDNDGINSIPIYNAIDIDPDLTPGDYTLRITVKDTYSNEQSTASEKITVVEEIRQIRSI